MKVDVLKIDGSKSGESVELSESIFGIEPNDHVIYLSVKAFLANQRQGTHKSKERNEVRGGGRKPWKQKGRGTARAGTTRSPLWVGGGRIFGPKPRNYRQKINKKVNQLARRSALSYKAKSEQVIVVENFSFEAPKTKEFAAVLNALNIAGKKTLLLTNEHNANIYKSGRNIPKVNILEARNASAYDLLNNQVLVLQKGAIETLETILN
ncbi:MAG: 50S ribosomal protein L4 [Melioribacteraceae bacterium]|nr:50S ribosomal protein L4 [Melioribacteraceae bacterium]MCF8264242.1 50S ribosomal protein L4 [Melioribacteraceae bacterium]